MECGSVIIESCLAFLPCLLVDCCLVVRFLTRVVFSPFLTLLWRATLIATDIFFVFAPRIPYFLYASSFGWLDLV